MSVSLVAAKSPLDVARANRSRIGALAFPISGLVAAFAALVPGIGMNPAVDAAGFAQAANYVGLANLVGIVSLVFLLFGFEALHAFLERNSVDKWAFAGMILSVIGLGLFLPFLGIFTFADLLQGESISAEIFRLSVSSQKQQGQRTRLPLPSAESLFYSRFSGGFFSPWPSGDLASYRNGRPLPTLFRLP